MELGQHKAGSSMVKSEFEEEEGPAVLMGFTFVPAAPAIVSCPGGGPRGGGAGCGGSKTLQ